jgi:hypothetical protein
MSDYNAYWMFTAILLLLLMVFFGDFLYRKHWGDYSIEENSPAGAPKRNYVPLNQNPIIMDP